MHKIGNNSGHVMPIDAPPEEDKSALFIRGAEEMLQVASEAYDIFEESRDYGLGFGMV